MQKYLLGTNMLDYKNKKIQELIQYNHWNKLDTFNKIHQIYLFVRDTILFGYNKDDKLTASKVLSDGYGQCNTKSTLLMALLRSVGIPCRLHGFLINKKVQKGIMGNYLYWLAPNNVLHTWVEVYYSEKWNALEGVIVDNRYLDGLQAKFDNCNDEFCGYGVATKNFTNLNMNWSGTDTYIQKEAIFKDLGIYDTPDAFYSLYTQQIGPLKELAYRYVGRKIMNQNVKNLRDRSTI